MIGRIRPIGPIRPTHLAERHTLADDGFWLKLTTVMPVAATLGERDFRTQDFSKDFLFQPTDSSVRRRQLLIWATIFSQDRQVA